MQSIWLDKYTLVTSHSGELIALGLSEDCILANDWRVAQTMMDISEALLKAKDGASIRRVSWRKESDSIDFVGDGYCKRTVPWSPNCEDLNATDWIVNFIEEA